MLFGLNKNNDRVYIENAINDRKQEYICPICRQPLIIKNGKINTPHFAHKSLEECDTFTQDVSQWHKDWQDVFPRKNQEVILRLDITDEEYLRESNWYDFSKLTYQEYMSQYEDFLLNNKERKLLHIEHRADVLACGYVIEFQHSPISSREFNERNWFYNRCGYKVIWIFDFIDKYDAEQIAYFEEWSNGKDNGAKYKWNNAVKTFIDFIPQKHKPHYINNKWWNGDVILFFQLYHENDEEDNCIIERVLWAIEDDEQAKFKRFITSYNPGTKQEFKQWIIKRRL